jgi:hypothetical protein
MKKGWNISGITDRFIDPIPAHLTYKDCQKKQENIH